MRQDVSTQDLAALVETAVLAKVLAGETFTVFDVTSALRQAHPGLNIIHQETKSHTHGVARRVVQAGSYTCSRNAHGAMEYAPVPQIGDGDAPDGDVQTYQPDDHAGELPADGALPKAPTNVRPAGMDDDLHIP